MADEIDPRLQFRQCTITEDEFAVILEYHRSTIMAQQYESIGLATHSTCFRMRAIHAVERLKTLDPAAWKRVDEELDREIPNWIKQANARSDWEEREAKLYKLEVEADEEWAAFISCVEEQQATQSNPEGSL